MIVSHPALDIGLKIPLHRTCSKGSLRLDDLLKEGILGRFVDDLVKHTQLRAQNGIRGLEKLNALLGLHFCVIF